MQWCNYFKKYLHSVLHWIWKSSKAKIVLFWYCWMYNHENCRILLWSSVEKYCSNCSCERLYAWCNDGNDVLNEQDEVVEEKVTALLPSSVLSGVVDTNWKDRLSAVEKMTDVCWMFLWLIMLYFLLGIFVPYCVIEQHGLWIWNLVVFSSNISDRLHQISELCKTVAIIAEQWLGDVDVCGKYAYSSLQHCLGQHVMYIDFWRLWK